MFFFFYIFFSGPTIALVGRTFPLPVRALQRFLAILFSMFPFLVTSSLTSFPPRSEPADDQPLADDMHELVLDEFDMLLFR